MLLDTGKACASIFFLLITAQMYSRMLTLSRLPETLTGWASALDVPALAILLAFVLVLIILGCIIDSVSILLLTMPIFVPIIKSLGYDPIWFGVLFCMNMQISYLSPPFGPAAFYLKGVAPPEISLDDIFRALWPFMLMQLLALLIVLFFPGIALWLPSLN